MGLPPPPAPRRQTPLFRLDEAARLTGGTVLSGDPATAIHGFSIDTRTLGPGDAFVAFAGERTDGHRHLGAAAERGAAAALVTRAEAAAPESMARLHVADATTALQALAAVHRARFDIPRIAVTGSNGKTTTRAAIATVLGAGLEVASTRGNLNNHIGLPLSLFALDERHRAGVFEVGMSHLGEIATLCRILEPRMGVLTNVGPAHLEGLGSLENVARAKAELMEALPPDGELFFNADCPIASAIAARYAGTRSGVSLSPGTAYAWVGPLTVGFGRLSGTLHVASDLTLPFSAPLSGRHMAYPLLFAAAIAHRLGLGPETIAAGLAAFAPEHGRMEVRERRGVQVVDDCYNANPASMEAALDFLLNVPVRGRRFAVLGDMLELGVFSAEYHRKLAGRCRAADGLEVAYLHGKECEAVRDEMGGRVRFAPDKSAIARELADVLAPGDVLLVKGSRGVALETVLEELFGKA